MGHPSAPAARSRLARAAGNYTCTVTATNQAGSASQTSATPTALIDELIVQVNGLGLPSGLKNSLVQKLEGAKKNVSKGDFAGACDKLASFISAVGAQSGKAIEAEDAADLIADASAIRASLGCS